MRIINAANLVTGDVITTINGPRTVEFIQLIPVKGRNPLTITGRGGVVAVGLAGATEPRLYSTFATVGLLDSNPTIPAYGNTVRRTHNSTGRRRTR